MNFFFYITKYCTRWCHKITPMRWLLQVQWNPFIMINVISCCSYSDNVIENARSKSDHIKRTTLCSRAIFAYHHKNFKMSFHQNIMSKTLCGKGQRKGNTNVLNSSMYSFLFQSKYQNSFLFCFFVADYLKSTKSWRK